MESEIYHVYNRGSNKIPIFIDESDYLRFLKILAFFNNKKPVSLYSISKKERGSTSLQEVGLPEQEDKLVEILCYCLMPNHYHLILRSLAESGIATFMKKLGTGYTMYFNQKYKGSGHLFQGRYKYKEIKSDDGFVYLSGYIHINPVVAKITKAPENYKYSSYLNFLGNKEDSFLTVSGDLFDMKPSDYKKFIYDLIEGKKLLEKIEDIKLD